MTTSLQICGLEYRVVFASSDEVPLLREKEGMTAFDTNTIYVRSGMPLSRMRDTLVHEVMHAFLESSGVGYFLQDSVKVEDFEKFEETLIRLLVPSVLRLVEENGQALVDVPKECIAEKKSSKGRGKRAR